MSQDITTKITDPAMDAYLGAHAARQLEELKEWLRIPSISTQSKHRPDSFEAARLLGVRLEEAGMENLEIIDTPGNPLVYADWLHAGSDRPTVLLYGHYDVQPTDPLDKWVTPPFEPSLRGDDLYARGATDDKGQLFALVKAVEALFRVRGKLPVNVKIVAEGDEESGVEALEPFVKQNGDLLAADVCLISDTAVITADQPCISYRLRGMWAGELFVRGPVGDLHSGGYGGVVHNTAQALGELLATLHDGDGRVTVAGFYDNVEAPTPEERQRLAQVPYGEEQILEETGVPALYGEPGFTPLERIAVRPTLEINGMWGGYTGEGFKTVIPAEARARISCRLVAGQDPERIGRLVIDHLQKAAPATVTVEVTSLFTTPAVFMDPDSPAMKAAARAYERAFGRAPVFKGEGGGIPIVSTFQECLTDQVILMGFGLPDDNAHAPNEKMYLPNFYRGIRTAVYFLEELAAATSGR